MAPELLILGMMIAGLTLYAVLGGADFGAGVWEVNTALGASPEERALIYRAVGPVWEANHVWLIFVLVCLFSAFPPAFAVLNRTLWLPLLLALVGIVFRGMGFVFRSYAVGAARQQAVWGVVFALASTAAPFFLGATVGALASGRLRVPLARDSAATALLQWLTPLAIFGGFFAVGVCAYLAAVYLTREAAQQGDPALVSLWRQRALATGAWMGVLAVAGLGMVAADAPALWAGFRSRAWPLVGVSGVAGVCSLWALWSRRFTAAAFSAASAVAAVVWGWSAAQYPILIPPAMTIAAAKGPEAVLWALVWAITIGAVLLVPALGYLFYLFKGQHPQSLEGGA